MIPPNMRVQIYIFFAGLPQKLNILKFIYYSGEKLGTWNYYFTVTYNPIVKLDDTFAEKKKNAIFFFFKMVSFD